MHSHPFISLHSFKLLLSKGRAALSGNWKQLLGGKVSQLVGFPVLGAINYSAKSPTGETYYHSVLSGGLCNEHSDAGFEVLRAVVMKSYTFCDIALYSPLKVNQHFGGTRHLRLQG
jgi:hypothetical protein